MIWGKILPISAEGSRGSGRAGNRSGDTAEGDRIRDTTEGGRGDDTATEAAIWRTYINFILLFFYDCQQHEMYSKCYKRWKLFLDNFSWKLFFMKLLFGKWKPFLWKMETFFWQEKIRKKTGKIRKNQEKSGKKSGKTWKKSGKNLEIKSGKIRK